MLDAREIISKHGVNGVFIAAEFQSAIMLQSTKTPLKVIPVIPGLTVVSQLFQRPVLP